MCSIFKLNVLSSMRAEKKVIVILSLFLNDSYGEKIKEHAQLAVTEIQA